MSTPVTDLPRKKHTPYVPATMEMTEWSYKALFLGLSHDSRAGSGQCLSGLAGRYHHSGNLPCGCDCDGGGSSLERIDPGRKHLANGGLDRGIRRCWSDLHAACVRALQSLAIVPAGRRLSESTALIMVGSILGVLFISLVRRGMVEDPGLPFPESLAASEIHKAGQRGAQAAKYLFWNIGVGGIVYILGKFGLFAADTDLHVGVGSLGHSQVRLGTAGSTHVVATGGTTVSRPPASVQLISASVTSLGSSWHRSSLRAACWRGD